MRQLSSRLLARLAAIAASVGVAAALALPASAADTDTLALIGAQIEQHAVVRADFTQSKQMAALKRPLLTSGHLVFSRRHGVLWQIEQPYRMSYVLGEDRIVEIAADGTRRERGLREVPGLAQVGRVFRALLGANTVALREVFNANVRGDASKWEIELKPRQPQLAQFLSGLTLSGGSFVDSIRINEAGGSESGGEGGGERNGDTTLIRFRNSHAAEAPSAAELQLFGVPGKP